MNIIFEWVEKAQCWEHKTEDRVMLIYKHPIYKYFLAIGEVNTIITNFLKMAGGNWKLVPYDSIYTIMDVVERELGGTVKFRDPNEKGG